MLAPAPSDPIPFHLVPTKPQPTMVRDSLLQGAVTASASGKVLLTGGYLVLDQKYSGLVSGVSARFHSSVARFASRDQLQAILLQQQQSVENDDGHPPTENDPGKDGRDDSKSRVFHLLKDADPSRYGRCPVIVSAPQVGSRLSIYELEFAEPHPDTGRLELLEMFRLTPLTNPPNRFIDSVLRNTLMVLASLQQQQHQDKQEQQGSAAESFAQHLGVGLGVFVHGDRPFYTSAAAPAEGPGDRRGIQQIQLSSKTGLGSSAALVSSLVAALFAFFQHPFTTTDGKIAEEALKKRTWELSHSTAQFCHCSAQGKVGSGFDVYCGFFGSNSYRRFDPLALRELLDLESEGKLTRTRLIEDLTPTAEEEETAAVVAEEEKQSEGKNPGTALTPAQVWRAFYRSASEPSAEFDLPPGMILLLGDVQGGSETPGMVSKVLAWREFSPETAEEVWEELSGHNDRVRLLLQELQTRAEDPATKSVYDLVRTRCAQTPAVAWNVDTMIHADLQQPEHQEILRLFIQLHTAFQEVRQGLRRMGQEAGVPIEPPAQTQLLEETMKSPGVIMAGVPGAGGEDAIFAVVLDEVCVEQLVQRWESYRPAAVEDGGAGGDEGQEDKEGSSPPAAARISRLSVQESRGGMQFELETSLTLREFLNYPSSWD